MKTTEFQNMTTKLAEQRKKKDNQIGKGGFMIELKNPKDFQNTMDLVLAAPDKNLDENKLTEVIMDLSNDINVANVQIFATLCRKYQL